MHNVQPYDSEITHAKSSRPPRCFSADLGVKISSKPSKWLYDIKTRTTWTELVFYQWIYFHLRSRNIFMALPHGSVADWDFSQSWQHLAVKSVHYGKRAFAYKAAQKRSAVIQTNRENSSLLKCPFPCMKLSACISHSSICYDDDCSSSISTSVSETNRK